MHLLTVAIAVLGIGLTSLFSSLAAIWRIYMLMKSISDDVHDRINKVASESEEKRARLYQRLDEVKRFSDDTFMRKDMCNIISSNICKELAKTNVLLERLFDNHEKRNAQ